VRGVDASVHTFHEEVGVSHKVSISFVVLYITDNSSNLLFDAVPPGIALTEHFSLRGIERAEI
jgi:hypothetical protein